MAAPSTTIPSDGSIEYIFPLGMTELPRETDKGCVLVSLVILNLLFALIHYTYETLYFEYRKFLHKFYRSPVPILRQAQSLSKSGLLLTISNLIKLQWRLRLTLFSL